ncbi:MAG: hypothetical protein O2U61_03890 [Candidatus Bathyarchaeota archaeon]|nr:hypothetical protein [Candidatus Bathyarchaeota archaeon]
MIDKNERIIQEIRRAVEKLKDKTGRPVEPNIKELVVGLWWCGIQTESSCEGRLDSGPRCPWVNTPFDQAEKIARVLSWQNLSNKKRNKNTWIIKPGVSLKLMPQKINVPLEKLHERAIEFGLALQSLPDEWFKEKCFRTRDKMKKRFSMSSDDRHAFLFLK